MVWMLVVAGLVQAQGSGQGCDSSEPTVEEYNKAIQLGYKTQSRLEQLYTESGDTVALISRVGSDTPEKRFQQRVGEFWRYTHSALVFRNHPAGQWSVVHLLNTCGENSDIFVQGLMRFSLDKPYVYSNAISRLTPDLQDRLEAIVLQHDLAKKLHASNNQYSSISSPYNQIYQNSNEYILTILATAIAPANQMPQTFDQAKHFFLTSAMRAYFTAEVVKVGFFERFGKSVGFGPGNARLDDHSKAERRKGRFDMVSSGSLHAFVQKSGMQTGSFEISL